MATSYINVYNRFLGKVTDYFVFELSDEDTCNYCHDLLLSALANVTKLEHNLNIDEEEYCFAEDLNNLEIEYLACQMACEWMDPQIQNTTLTRQYIGTKDEKFYAPANQLKELRSLREDLYARVRKIRRDYHYDNNAYLNAN